VLLAVIFMASGGKPYYLAGLLSALLGAGSVWVDDWLDHGRRAARIVVLAAALALSAVIDGVISLPVFPARDADFAIDANEDVGETIGWPELAGAVAGVYRDLPNSGRPVILTRNYGEAGAIDRYAGDLGLPSAYSGHNAYGDWGPPPEGAAPVIAVGLPPDDREHLRDCRPVAGIDNGLDVDNDEQGTEIYVCAGPKRRWAVEWPSLRHLG
jgi:hypothetical protein